MKCDSIECFNCGRFFKRTIGSFYFQWSGRFFMDVTRRGRFNPKKRLTHFTIKAGCKKEIIINKWKGRCYLRPSSRTVQWSLTESAARTHIDDQHNARRSSNASDEDDDELSGSDDTELEHNKNRRMQNSG